MNEPQMIVRFFHPDQGPRVGVQVDALVHDVTESYPYVGSWLRASAGRMAAALEGLAKAVEKSTVTYPAESFAPQPDRLALHWLAPVDEQDVWAAGVTYERSRTARQEEAVDGGDIYARVYEAERPELFFKAQGNNVIGPGGAVGIRADAAWNVPEPELGVVLNPAMTVVGFTVGNDMSSRDIEGQNPLYLPQAKVYDASCALGPGLLLQPADEWPQTTIRLSIRRDGSEAFAGEVHTSRIHRTLADLVAYLGRSSTFESGVVLLTGTGIVPPGDFTLAAGDVITITIDGIGTLTNTVKVV